MKDGSNLRIRRLRVLAGAAALMGLGLAAGAARAEEDTPKSIDCTFSSGVTGSYEGGVFQSKTSSPLSFSIEDIDIEAQKATLKSGKDVSEGKLSVVRAINANHYLEVVNEGFLNLTTVYDKDESTGKYPAVHSRHFGFLGQPSFAQYTGFCTEASVPVQDAAPKNEGAPASADPSQTGEGRSGK